MVFTSSAFLVFFPVLFGAYWFLAKQNLRAQNAVLLLGSYVFYAKADWRFLTLLVGASLLNFLLGIQLEKRTRYHKFFLGIGLIQGIGCLLYFKYCNFFIDSFAALLGTGGGGSLHLLVPLGISFYTFRTMSYILDVDKGKIAATRDALVFFNYVSFFPCLLSGPIDKASLLVPQLQQERRFEYAAATDGMRQILWGLFKKLVIADNCGAITGPVFGDYQALPASSLLVPSLLYTVQIYADFSGYSDMALGIARLLGFRITKNFAYPLFAQNIAEFWRKWHISLTAWLTEYVFTPLSIAFRDLGKAGIILAILINFTLIGIWHGPSWTYVLFGFLHGCYFIPLILKGTMNKKQKFPKDQVLPGGRQAFWMVFNYVLVSLTFILFVAPDLQHAFGVYRHLIQASLLAAPAFPVNNAPMQFVTLAIATMVGVEWVQRHKEHGLQLDAIRKRPVRILIYYTLIFSIVLLKADENNPFIYFKF